MSTRNRVLLTALVGLAPTAALATNGYFSHGYGVRSQSVAGVGIALPHDGLAAATNPAGTALVGDRLDVGLSLFRPDRGASIHGNQAGANGDYSGNGKANFFIPELGYARQASPAAAWGLAIYGNGGMNTDYRQNPYAAFGSRGRAGVVLSQLFVTPSVAYKLTPDHAIGGAVTFAYQRFAARGLGAFDNAFVSSHPGSVTDQGHDSATGWGVKLGWIGTIAPTVKLGAAWSSRIEAGNFDRYKGLFAEGGGFDIPATYGLGVAWQASPVLTLAADWQRIDYAKVKSVGNPLQQLFAGGQLGSTNGAGFGWRNISVFKLGAVYTLSPQVTLRAGYSRAGNPIPQDQTFFNILAPGVVRDHLSVGLSWKQPGGGEWSAAYTRGLRKTVSGQGSLPASFGGGEADVHLGEDILGVAYTWRL